VNKGETRNMKIILSKSQWEEIGRKANWIIAEDQLQPLDGVQNSPAARVEFKTSSNEERECRWCGKPYIVNKDDDGFCCDDCNAKYHSEKSEKTEKEAKSDNMTKESLNYDIYKSIRKDMPPPGQVIEDGKGYKRQNTIDVDEELTINDLINEAEVAAEYRGHKLGKWETFMRGNRSYSNNKCEICGKEVQVIDHPLPNEIDIGGEAVALSCE
jgi:hypothetical protein